MSKSLLCSSIVSSGVAVAVLAALRLAAEPPPAAIRSHRPIAVTPALAVSSRPSESSIIELPELRIRSSVVRRFGEQRAASPEPPELVPCSDWRELGPVYSVRAGEAPRQRRVQMLCARSSAGVRRK